MKYMTIQGNKSKEKFLRKLIACITMVTMLLSIIPATIFADTISEDSDYTVSDAVLYVDDGGNLGYNVVYTATTETATIVTDLTGNGIDTIEELKENAVTYAVSANIDMNEYEIVTNIYVTAVVTRPRVGISWKSDTIGSDYTNFAEAFNRNGADAFFLPQFTSQEEASAYLIENGVDGVFETGGSDVNPYFYGETLTPHGSGAPNNDRDISDIAVIRAAIELDVPLLGVCRGEQIFNVAMGGGLIQDIPYYLGQKVLSGEIDVSRVTTVLSGKLPGSTEVVQDTGYNVRDFSHLLGSSAIIEATYDVTTNTYLNGYGCDGDGHLRVWIDGIVHSGSPSYHELGNSDYAAIDSNSKWLYDIAGGSSIDLVATAHHQAVDPDKLGDGLTIVAHSEDGIVEAIEYQDNLFALGIQFHPERDALGDSAQAISNGEDPDQDTCNSFLRALVSYAAIHDGYTGNYLVTVEDTTNGTVTADILSPEAGDIVTLSVTPDTGYVLSELQIVAENGDLITTALVNGCYTFTMPESAISVSAVFAVAGTTQSDESTNVSMTGEDTSSTTEDSAVEEKSADTEDSTVTEETPATGETPETGDKDFTIWFVLFITAGSIIIGSSFYIIRKKRI